jgi:hypothetical protein
VGLSDSENPLDIWDEEEMIERQKQIIQTELSFSSTCYRTDDPGFNSWHRK